MRALPTEVLDIVEALQAANPRILASSAACAKNGSGIIENTGNRRSYVVIYWLISARPGSEPAEVTSRQRSLWQRRAVSNGPARRPVVGSWSVLGRVRCDVQCANARSVVAAGAPCCCASSSAGECDCGAVDARPASRIHGPGWVWVIRGVQTAHGFNRDLQTSTLRSSQTRGVY